VLEESWQAEKGEGKRGREGNSFSRTTVTLLISFLTAATKIIGQHLRISKITKPSIN
jgi:hypothetical protein